MDKPKEGPSLSTSHTGLQQVGSGKECRRQSLPLPLRSFSEVRKQSQYSDSCEGPLHAAEAGHVLRILKQSSLRSYQGAVPLPASLHFPQLSWVGHTAAPLRGSVTDFLSCVRLEKLCSFRCPALDRKVIPNYLPSRPAVEH